MADEVQRAETSGREQARPARAASQLAPPARGLAAYLQIEEELASRIERGMLEPGTRLPSERELARSLGVSRMTLRQALSRLEHRGLIDRAHGSGTFVAEPKLRHQANVLRGFFRETVGQGVVPTTRTIERSAIFATRVLAQTLDLRIGEEVYKVVRLRSARGTPVVVETSFFPAALFPGLIEEDLDHRSIYELMERYGARPVRGEQGMESVAAEAEEAALLGVAPGAPLMLLERTTWDATGRPVEHARDLYRGDRSRFLTELRL
ncbi:MAG TPA: GntR family transcriptional regulator [candidate division Zixibacteria bacterium]|nr:GntR family transcriptional regulator [candidate division Zixibacteria bacterium]